MGAGVWLRETPRPQVPSVTPAPGAGRGARNSRSRPSRCPRFRLPGGGRTMSGLFSAGGSGGAAGSGPAPSGLGPPAPPLRRRPHTGGFPLRRGRPRRFHRNNGALRSGPRRPVAEAPAGPRLHPAPSGPPTAPRRPGRALLGGWANTYRVTCGLCRAAETPPGLPALLRSQGIPACTPLTLPEPLRSSQPRTLSAVTPPTAPTLLGGRGDGGADTECNAQAQPVLRENAGEGAAVRAGKRGVRGGPAPP